MMTFAGNRLTLTGALKLESHRGLRDDSAGYLGDRDIEVDLTDVTEVDSSALALIFHWRRLARGYRVILRNPPESLLALADLYGVAELLDTGPVPVQAHPDR